MRLAECASPGAPVRGFLVVSVLCGVMWASGAALAYDYPIPIHRGNGLANVFARLNSGQSVTIAYIGGSVTEMPGWRSNVTAWFNSKYPGKITEINAGWSGTGSLIGAMRLARDVLAHDPDLIFIEFAINDLPEDPIDFVRRNCEGMVRQAWQQDPYIDICFIETISFYIESPYLSGYYPTTVQGHYDVCDFYGISSVNVGWALYEVVLGGTPWTSLTINGDRVHPNEAGSLLYSNAVTSYLEAERTRGGTWQAHTVGAALTTLPVTSSTITNWVTVSPLPSGWSAHYNEFGLANFVQSNTPGSQISIPFIGPSAAVKCLVSGDSGDVQYSVDGSAFAPANITVNGYTYLWAFPVAKNLANSSHTLTVRVTSGTARLINVEAAVSSVTPIMNNNTPTGTKLGVAAWQTDSDYSVDFNGAKALDGLTSTKWASTGTVPPHWLTVDLGTNQTVNGYILRNASTGGEPTYMNTKYFSFQTGTSMTGPWTDDAVVDNSAQAGVVARSYITPKSVRYVRLHITNCGIDNYTRIPEFEVWGAATAPLIVRSPSSLTPVCEQGSNASSQTFTVANGGGGTLSYTISDNVSWLSCSPTSGTSTGEQDTITVTYSTSGLSAGTYNGTITITDPSATNNPQAISVSLTVSAGGMNDSVPTGVNVAPQSAQVSTDSNYSSSYTGAKAIDGVVSAASKWCSNGNAPPHWLALDLGSNKTVNGFVVRMAGAAGEYSSYNFESFKLQSGSSISGPWTDECSVSNPSQVSVIARSYLTPKVLRYVRIYVTDCGIDNYARLPEFEVYAPGSGTVAEDFSSMPSWTSSFDASWGSAATWSIVSGGQSGNALQASRGSQGSSAKVKVYGLNMNTNYTISVWIKCPSYTANSYWAECAYKLGSYTAEDFDQNGGTWAMVKKFAGDGANGNGNTWTQYSATFNSGSNTQISVGFKLGSSGGAGPTVLWDTLRVQ